MSPDNTMEKERIIEDGIVVKKSYKVKSKSNHSKEFLFAIYQIVLTFLATLSATLCFATGLELEIRVDKVVLFAILSSLLFFILSRGVLYLLTTVPITLFLYSLLLYENKQQLLEGIYHIENAFIRQYNTYTGRNILHYIVKSEDGTYAVTLLILFGSFLFCGFVTYMICFGKNSFLYTIVCVAIIAAPCVIGRIPDSLWFAIYIISMVSILVMTPIQGVSIHLIGQRTTEHKFRQQIILNIGLICSIILVVLLGISNYIVTPAKYAAVSNPELKDKLQNELSDMTIDTIKTGMKNLFTRDQTTGGLSGGDLYRQKQSIDYQHKTQLTVDLPEFKNTLYLKGYVGTQYNGIKWGNLSKKELDEYDQLFSEEVDDASGEKFSSSMQLTELILLFMKYDIPIHANTSISVSNMSVQYDRANKEYAYAPYNTVFSREDGEYEFGEQYIAPSKPADFHTFYYYDVSLNEENLYELCQYVNMILEEKDVTLNYSSRRVKEFMKELKQFVEVEERYRGYAYDVYTKLPKEGLKRVKKDFGGFDINQVKYHRLVETGKESLSEIIKQLQNYFSTETKYSLDIEGVPKNEDYIEHFLYTSKQGYCSHYASAATVILRAMGIPARYVEGYSIPSSKYIEGISSGTMVVGNYQDIKMDYKTVERRKVTVDDSMAHAWVEIYLDQIGWYPIEFTPSATNTDDGEIIVEDKKEKFQDEVSKEEISEITVTPTPIKNSTNNEADISENKEEQNNVIQEEKHNSKDTGIDKNSTKDDSLALELQENVDATQGRIRLPGWLRRTMYILGVWLLAMLCLFLHYRYRWINRCEYFKKHSNSDNAIYLYEELQKIVSYLNYEVPEKDNGFVRSIYLKALYSNQMISDEEYQEMRHIINQIVSNSKTTMSKLRTIWLIYGKCFFLCNTNLP